MTIVTVVAAPSISPWRGTDRGTTREALSVPRRVSAILQSLIDLSVGGKRRASRVALAEAFSECSTPGWDGHDASPADPRAASWTEAVVASLLPTLGLPHYSFDPDGDAILEWFVAHDRVLDMSVGNNGEIRYAATIGGSMVTGIEEFSDGPPPGLLAVARRLSR